MKKQVKKLVVLLGVASTFVLMSFNEPRWFAGIYDVKMYCSDHGRFVELDYNLEWDAYYGYCVCNPGWFGNMCEFMEEDL